MSRALRLLLPVGGLFICSTSAFAILAGGEFDLPVDSPSSRLDTEGAYGFVGALEINAGG